MNCPHCGYANADTAKYCGDCARPFVGATPCPSCGAENPPGQKFCNECARPLQAVSKPPSPERSPRDYTPHHLAEKILQSKSALEGERKQVTVLFADVRHSMELAEALDPEEWHRILERFFEILTDGVHRFEGTVNQYTGDGIMALFGAPIAHEDHAQRACYAALQMRDGLLAYARELKREKGLQFSTRIGIHSGEVVVGKIGDDLRMDYTAQGATVGLAARMENLASPDTIYLAAPTAERVAGFFELEDLGEFHVKGASEPIEVFELKGLGALRTRFEVARARGLSRFVGRDDEMSALHSALEHARHGQARVVGVVAHAGVGKSRLCFEFVERCRARGMFVMEGRAVLHGKNIPLLPMMEAFRAYFGIGEADDPRAVREKIAGRMLLIDEGFRDVLALLFDFFGVPDPERPVPRMDPDARRRQIVGVLRRVIQKDEWDEPVVTLLEDLHWFDAGSEAFLREWVDALPASRNLLVLNFRPEYRADWMQSSHYQQIPLEPLGPEAIRALLDDLLGADPSTAGLAAAVHERTRGNPFFTEEVVRSLIERGHLEGVRGAYRLVTALRELRVPDSVQAVLAARIDRLAEREKQLLQTAAVIGKSFEEPVLEAVANLPKRDLGDALAALRNAEFLYEESLYPVVEYGFKHPLTQEVALGSQLSARRGRLHAAVARAIEGLKPDDLDEQAALLAHHWEEAGEPLPGARWAARAAGWASAREPREGVRLWSKAAELARRLPDSAEAVRLLMEACREILMSGAWRTGMPMEEVEAFYEEGKRLAGEAGDRHSLAALEVAYLAPLAFSSGDVARWAEGAVRILSLVEEDDDPELLAALAVNLSYSHSLLGRLDEALPYARMCAELGQRRPDLGKETLGFNVPLWGVMDGALLEGFGGDLQGGVRQLRAATRSAREAGEAEVLGWTLNNTVQLLTLCAGELADTPSLARESLEASERVGSSFSRVHSLSHGALADLLRGEWDAAVGSLEHALAIAREERAAVELEPQILAYLAQAYCGRGERERAERLADEALAMARARSNRWAELMALVSWAQALLAAETTAHAPAIQTAIDALAALAEETGMRVFAPQALELRARLAALCGDVAGRDALLRETHRVYVEIGATGHAERVARELRP